MKNLNRLIFLCGLGLVALNVGCAGDTSDFSVLPVTNTFYQSTSSSNSKIDILWVVDNSLSMDTSQDNLANNFPSFIQGFSQRNLDFQIAVTGTDAFIALPSMTVLYNYRPYYHSQSQDLWAKFRDGNGVLHSLVYVINQLTPNLQNTFITNVRLGTQGIGDERPFQSMKTALNSSLNAGFVRPNSYLAIIMLTDEDDFSNDSIYYLEDQYTNPNLHSVASYASYLDQLTGSTASRRLYSVNSIAILDNDQTCLDQLNQQSLGRKYAKRVNQLVDMTDGIKTSLCGNFGSQLDLIANNVLELANQFYLNRLPDPSTISVVVNGQTVPKSESNPLHNGGWYYNSTSNSIIFQGEFIPSQGSTIQVNFDPVSLGS